jgi:hypothetical protein
MSKFEKIYQEALNQTTTIDPNVLKTKLPQVMKTLDPSTKAAVGAVTGAVEDATIDPEQQILDILGKNPQLINNPKVKEILDKLNAENPQEKNKTEIQNPTLSQVQKSATPSPANTAATTVMR